MPQDRTGNTRWTAGRAPLEEVYPPIILRRLDAAHPTKPLQEEASLYPCQTYHPVTPGRELMVSEPQPKDGRECNE